MSTLKTQMKQNIFYVYHISLHRPSNFPFSPTYTTLQPLCLSLEILAKKVTNINTLYNIKYGLKTICYIYKVK